MSPKRPVNRRTNIFLAERSAPLFNRLMAKAIDILLVVAIYFVGAAMWKPFGLFCALLFCATQDAMWVGQSVGKRIIGLRVIDDHRGLPCGLRHSFLRNLPFLIAIPLAAISWGWVFFLIVAVPLLALEAYLVIALESGTRLGDILGNTIVVEYLQEGLQEFQ